MVIQRTGLASPRGSALAESCSPSIRRDTVTLPSEEGDFSIEQAIKHCLNNAGTILLRPAVYYEHLLLVSDLTIRGIGDGPDDVVIQGVSTVEPVCRVEGHDTKVHLGSLRMRGGGDGLRVAGSSVVRIDDVWVEGNSRRGIYVLENGFLRIGSGRIRRNCACGIVVGDSARLEAADSVVEENDGPGLWVGDEGKADVLKTQIRRNKDVGATFRGIASGSLHTVKVWGNSGDGIVTSGQADVEISNCELRTNEGFGVRREGTSVVRGSGNWIPGAESKFANRQGTVGPSATAFPEGFFDELRTVDRRRLPHGLQVEVNYDTKRGLILEASYRERGRTERLPPILGVSESGWYVQIGDKRYPLDVPTTVSGVAEASGGKITIPVEDIPRFVLEDLAQLTGRLRVVRTSEAARISVEDIRPLVRIDVAGPGWFDFRVEVAGEPVGQFLAGGHATAHRAVRKDDYTWEMVSPHLLAKIDTEIRRLPVDWEAGGTAKIPAMLFASLEALVEAIGGRQEVSEAYARFRDRLTGFAGDPSAALPQNVEQTLRSLGWHARPHQIVGIQWLTWLFENRLHGILADDMGLGKTLQTILAMRIARQNELARGPTLILCPKTVIGFWERELRNLDPAGLVCRYHGSSRDPTVWATPGHHTYITTYATAVADIKKLRDVHFRFLILDEGTNIKNPPTSRHKACKELHADHRLVLTGTPIENRVLDLWALFDFLMSGYLGSLEDFRRNVEAPIHSGHGQPEVADLHRKIHPFVLRRTKNEVGRELPPKIEREELCELTEEQRRLYKKLLDDNHGDIEAYRQGKARALRGVFRVLTRLRQVCDHPALVREGREPLLGRSNKFDRAVEKAKEILETDEQLIIFAHWLGALDLFEAHFRDQRVPYIRIDGSTQERDILVERFQQRDARVAICSVKAAGHGITMTAANHVIHFDRWWNLAVENQATDRTHRIGQTRTVYVHYLLVRGTLEERLASLIERKRGIADAVISPMSNPLDPNWTKEEILNLLEPAR